MIHNNKSYTMRKIIGIALVILVCVANYSVPVLKLRALPQNIWANTESVERIAGSVEYPFNLSYNGEVSAASHAEQTLIDVEGADSASGATVTVKLFDLIPVKQINVHIRKDLWVIPGGHAIGVSLHTQGALVVGVSDIVNAAGEHVSPASAAGLVPGDYILTADGVDVQSTSQLAQACVDGTPVELECRRNGEIFSTMIYPVQDERDGQYRMGVWVRDSTMGVGTLSFYDKTSGWYGALGHAIMDVDTGALMSVREGSIVASSIQDIVQGTKGEPGELRGSFNSGSMKYGDILINNTFGIFGRVQQEITNGIYPDGIPVAYPEEARNGSAQILTTVDSGGIQAYDCEIIRINPQSTPTPKGMVIQVTDPDLLSKTGGIIQGMSGSPLIQDGKLIGVVTHVFINDPTKGYCMFALWMLSQTG